MYILIGDWSPCRVVSRQIGKCVSSRVGARIWAGGGEGGWGEGPARSLLTAPPSRRASSSRLARRAPRRSARESGPRTGRQPSLLALCPSDALQFGTRPRPSTTLTETRRDNTRSNWQHIGLLRYIRYYIGLQCLCIFYSDMWHYLVI